MAHLSDGVELGVTDGVGDVVGVVDDDGVGAMFHATVPENTPPALLFRPGLGNHGARDRCDKQSPYRRGKPPRGS